MPMKINHHPTSNIPTNYGITVPLSSVEGEERAG
jgi:hypothetical protein